jgi:hypothetical protein
MSNLKLINLGYVTDNFKKLVGSNAGKGVGLSANQASGHAWTSAVLVSGGTC